MSEAKNHAEEQIARATESGETALSLNLPEASELPGSLANLSSQVEYLTIASERARGLIRLPEYLGRFSCLRELKLYENALTELPHFLGRLFSLARLTISGTEITLIPESLSDRCQIRPATHLSVC